MYRSLLGRCQPWPKRFTSVVPVATAAVTCPTTAARVAARSAPSRGARTAWFRGTPRPESSSRSKRTLREGAAAVPSLHPLKKDPFPFNCDERGFMPAKEEKATAELRPVEIKIREEFSNHCQQCTNARTIINRSKPHAAYDDRVWCDRCVVTDKNTPSYMSLRAGGRKWVPVVVKASVRK